MPMPDQEIQLPHTFLGDDRYLRMTFTHHGDIALQLRANDGLPQVFGLSHGHEAYLISTTLGYYARLGIKRSDTQDMLVDATQNVLQDISFHEATYRVPTFVTDQAMHIAENQPLSPRYNLSSSLTCLALPVPVHPGTTEQSRSTGLYTRLHETGNLVMVLAGLPPYKNRSEFLSETIPTAEFAVDDIPPFIKLISTLAMGEYRLEIAALVGRYTGVIGEDEY